MANLTEVELLRRDRHLDGRPLTQDDREQLVKPYLPAPRDLAAQPFPVVPPKPSASAYPSSSRWRRPHVRPLLARAVHLFLFHAIHFVFTLYIYGRQLCHALHAQLFAILYYHHRSPALIQKDVRGLSRLPKHLSIIVDLKGEEDDEREEGRTPEGLERLVKEVSEVSAWCACAGIEMLSVYERTGILKQHISQLHSAFASTLQTYFPTPSQPTFALSAPHLPSSSTSSPILPPSQKILGTPPEPAPSHLSVLLLSAQDGRSTLVDLTKTLAEMTQRGKISLEDISTELINAEMVESSCGDPDLLIVMAPSRSPSSPTSGAGRGLRGLATRRRRRTTKHRDSPGLRRHLGSSKGAQQEPGQEVENQVRRNTPGGRAICLQGYPPWQVQLTEIYYASDCGGVSYQDWLRALCRYAKAEMRFGR